MELRRFVVPEGTELTYRVWPTQGPPRATLAMFNGIMSNAAWFAPLAEGLGAAGLRLIGIERRGSGLNQEGWGDAPSAGVLVEDALAILEHENDGTPRVLLGWCWGAALSVAVAHKLSQSPAAIVLVTPGMFNTPALHEAIEVQREAIEAARPDEAVIASPIRDSMFTTSSALEDFVRADERRVLTVSPRMLKVTAQLATAAAIRLRKLDVPTLVVLAEDDEATDNEATTAFFAKLPPERIRTRTVPGRHGVQFDAPTETVASICDFIDTVLGPATV